MDLEYIIIQMGQNMKEIGQMINRMEQEKNHGLMENFMKENIKMEKKMDMEN